MPKAWFWSSTEILALAVLLVGAAAPTGAAVVERESVRFSIRPDGSVEETIEKRVRLESRSDLETWGIYGVHLDTHRELVDFSASVLEADGGQRRIGRKAQDKVSISGQGILHSSDFFHTVEMVGLEVGDRLQIRHTVVERPYFAANLWRLLGDEVVEDLEVVVRGGGPHWRHRIDGPADGLEIEPLEGGIRIRGTDLQPQDPSSYLVPGGSARRPYLRFAWGPETSWDDVGRWYRELLAPLPAGGEASRDLAESLVADVASEGDDPRDQLGALVAYLREKIRYVAVEVGIGGYQPSPPGEVLDRKWGDCKDKSLLLIDLLRQRGLEAYPALIRLDPGQQVDEQFPAPSEFNHLIVAVPTDVVSPRGDDPVAGDYLFIDPTQTRGGVTWLHPGVQDQNALVVTADGGELVRTPLVPEDEHRHLVFDLEIADDGSATGRAVFQLAGRPASAFVEATQGEPQERVAEIVLEMFQSLVPGAQLTEIGWSNLPEGVPTIRISVGIHFDALVEGRSDRPSLRLPSLSSSPRPRDLEDLVAPLVVRATSATTAWRLSIPKGWCAPEPAVSQLANPVGSLRRSIERDAEGRVRIEHRSQLQERWIDSEELEDLRALATAEYRSTRRRVRFHCSEGGGTDVSPPPTTTEPQGSQLRR